MSNKEVLKGNRTVLDTDWMGHGIKLKGILKTILEDRVKGEGRR